MASPQEHAKMKRLHLSTGVRINLRPWESVISYKETDSTIQVTIRTYRVKVLVREDRYEMCGIRGLMFASVGGHWKLLMDEIVWDDDFVPYVYEKIGRRKTADELTEQREFEKLCYRPGQGIDSYGRVLQGQYSPNEKRMEGHY